MGLLTDPSAGQGKFVKLLLKYHNQLCILLYIVGILWFCSLAYPTVNSSTYFSENALLPGLVKSQFREDKEAIRYLEELQDEMKKYDDSIPYPWLTAKFRQIGLDTYTHNFTLYSPLSKKTYIGKNVYGILRAPRGSSIEALVLSAPYRPPISVHPTTAPSIAIMLAFAKHANREKYWAKDIIFLITEHEQLGVQAWLEAYHGVTCGKENILDSGDIKGRAGSIQAAINLELHAERIGQMDVKIEGLNGQLPNLDLFNLASKMCSKEGLHHTFKNRGVRYYRDVTKEWWNNFKNLLAMMATQATGIPNGNHGLFHRFGIQALTMEGFEQTKARGGSKVGMMSMGRILESTFRSLNNLLERFHQSFFFYLLVSSERYVSIGLYITSVSLIAGSLFVKACAKWLQFQQDSTSASESGVPSKSRVRGDAIIIIFFLTHLVGFGIAKMPPYLASVFENYNYDTGHMIFETILGMSVLLLIFPVLVPFIKCEKSLRILNIFALLELGSALIGISMNNFSLGLFCAVVSVPFALFIRPRTSRLGSLLQRLLFLVVHPLLVLTCVVTVNSYFMFRNEGAKEIIHRGWDATEQAIIYSIVDSMIYGNWLYTVVTSILIPNWICFWTIASSRLDKVVEVSKEKKD